MCKCDGAELMLVFSAVPGLVPEQESEVPQERARHAGQQERVARQVLLRRRDRGGAADRAAPCAPPKRLPVLGQRRSLQVEPSCTSHHLTQGRRGS